MTRSNSKIQVEAGDKLTLITRTAVLICTVEVVRPRSNQATGAQGEEEGDDSDITIEVRIEDGFDSSTPSAGNGSSDRTNQPGPRQTNQPRQTNPSAGHRAHGGAAAAGIPLPRDRVMGAPARRE